MNSLLQMMGQAIKAVKSPMASLTQPKKEMKAMLMNIAYNPLTVTSTLRQLALHPNSDIRLAVAENANTPLDVLMLLAQDADADVRYALAENHNLPESVLKILQQDDNPYVSHRAQKTIERLKASGVCVSLHSSVQCIA